MRAQLLGLFVLLWVAQAKGREGFHCSCCCLFPRPCQLLSAGDLEAGSSRAVPLPPPTKSFCLGTETLNKVGHF